MRSDSRLRASHAVLHPVGCFVSIEAFSSFLAIEYMAMIIIGGLGPALGAVLGAAP